MLNIEKFSSKYTVKRIDTENLEAVLSLCRGNPMFYEHCPPTPTKESILEDMTALPEGKLTEDKYYLGFWSQGKLIAVMDLIDRYPDETTALIGFFMMSVSVQNQGIGSQIIGELAAYLKEREYRHIRLGWVKGNTQSEGFWHKNNFYETGTVRQTNDYLIVSAQREL